MRIWADYKRFFHEFRRDFHHTGALLPSGVFLARAVARPLAGVRPPARILEVGPGTGAVTRAIARAMRPGDRLEAVEINPHFARALEERVSRDPAYAAHRDNVHVINAPVQEVPGESVYDFILSGLPLNNFSTGDIRDIFATFTRLLRPGGTLSYFEYALIRELKAPFVSRRERRRLFRVGRLVSRYIQNYQVRRERILFNVPPAIVRQLCLKPAPGDAVSRAAAEAGRPARR
jgi:phosphatidylethanolamine/phosphatidyl-N-methylethanolamine N-methyltransferase